MCALTKDEVIAQLQKEVRILLHLASKIDRSQLDYRPTPKQRSTIELLRYLVNMGPLLVKAIKSGTFDVEAWQASTAKANAADFDRRAGDDSAHRRRSTQACSRRGPRPTSAVRSRCSAAARPAPRGCSNSCSMDAPPTARSCFCYLKSCGREELTTSNLWQGVDAAVPA